jgi:transposase-like protein
MSRSTISTFQLFAMFPDQETARVYLEGRLWPNGVRCPVCGLGERITTRKGGFYRCNQCKEDFTVRTGTIFERSHVPLHKWIYAMYLVVTARKGISSMQLAKEIGVTQKTAWFVLGRLREACGDNLDKLRGIVEIDEVYIGGKGENMHAADKKRKGGVPAKAAVLGMRERGGRTKAVPVPNASGATLEFAIIDRVEPGSTIHTDEWRGYASLRHLGYEHKTVNHKAGEYARDDVSTNSIESVWAVLKRGVYGTFHHVSPKHLGRYVDEFAFRLNEGNVQRHTLRRLDSFVDGAAGKRLTYKRLIG